MLSFKPRLPYTLTLLTTMRCNASCEECCFGCRPESKATMSLDQMKRYIDICCEAYPETMRILSLTGGECMLLGEDLVKAIEYAYNKGMATTMVTNGFWGKSYRKTYQFLKRLKSIGLFDIAVSTGERNQKIETYESCRNIMVAAARLGIGTEMRISNHWGHTSYTKLIDKDKALLRLINSKKVKVVWWEWDDDFSNENIGNRSYPWRIRPTEEDKPCTSLYHSIILTPFGDVMACCGIPCARIPYMRLGNIDEEVGIKSVYERGFADALKIWIHTKGPCAILKYVYDNTDIRFRHASGSRCMMCLEIFTNPKILPFLKESYFDWRKSIPVL